MNFPNDAWLDDELTKEQRQAVLMVLSQYRGVFESPDGKLPWTTLATHTIDTGNHVPIYIPPYRCSKVEEDIIQKAVDKLVGMRIVCESKSEWGTSTVLVTKKDGDWRLRVDYQALNKITRNEPYPPTAPDGRRTARVCEYNNTC